MNIAICMHGMAGTDGKYGKGKRVIDCRIAYKHLKERIIDVNNNVDIFYHTWSIDQSDYLNKTYEPISYLAEVQPDYSDQARVQSTYCRFNSLKKVVKLVENTGTQYDIIFITRFDVIYNVDFVFDEFNPNLFYAEGPAGPRVLGYKAIHDHFFFSKPENIYLYATMYDNLSKKKYQKHITSPHSLARMHLAKTGLNKDLEYLFSRTWDHLNRVPERISAAVPLIRWTYLKKFDDHLISNRGNLDGSVPSLENTVNHINKAIELGYEVKIDLKKVDKALYLFNSENSEEVDLDFIENPKLWCQAIDLDTFHYLLSKKVHCFYKEENHVCLSSERFLLIFPGKSKTRLAEDSICFYPELGYEGNIFNCAGICSDFIKNYNRKYSS